MEMSYSIGRFNSNAFKSRELSGRAAAAENSYRPTTAEALGKPLAPERRLQRWLNQKIAVFLGDYKDEREPMRDPSPCRAAIRSIFLLGLGVGFLVTLIFYFMSSPDVRVKQINNLGPGEKKHNSLVGWFYDRVPVSSPSRLYNESYGGRAGVGSNATRNTLSCPCTTPSIHWRNYVSFYALTANNSGWDVAWIANCQKSFGANLTVPCVVIPSRNDANIQLLKDGIVVEPVPLGGNPGNNTICDDSTLWNITSNKFFWSLGSRSTICYWLASLLFPSNETSSQYGQGMSTESRSTDILETPSLLDRETFFMAVAGVAQGAILQRRRRLDGIEFGSTDRRYYSAIADYLTELLNRGELDEYWQSFYEGAYYLQDTANVSITFEPDNGLSFFVGYSRTNPIFLHVQVNWTAYYETCAPLHCTKTEELKAYKRVVWAIATVGGLGTFAMGMITLILWPAVTCLIYLFHTRAASSEVQFP